MTDHVSLFAEMDAATDLLRRDEERKASHDT
jgi:hypothetical protein